MIVEQPDYHVYTGKVPELARLYADAGIALQRQNGLLAPIPRSPIR